MAPVSAMCSRFMSSRKILVTSALPYANAPLHLGHMLEQVQADIWVRFQRSRGHQCRYVRPRCHWNVNVSVGTLVNICGCCFN